MNDAPTLRALAARAETEAPSRELQEAVMRAFEWIGPHKTAHRWLAPGATHTVHRSELTNPLISADAALALMPEGWRITIGQNDLDMWTCEAWREDNRFVSNNASDLPRAVTALALRCRAADLEQEAKQ